jgi:hypothetical protein
VPPRFAYWTILVDDQPTAFRAKDHDELLPTFRQLKEKHPSAVMMWFQSGRLWRSQLEAHDAFTAARREEDRKKKAAEGPPRDRKWRPGGTHRDPRQKYIDAKKAKWTKFKKKIREGVERRDLKRAATPPDTGGSTPAPKKSEE